MNRFPRSSLSLSPYSKEKKKNVHIKLKLLETERAFRTPLIGWVHTKKMSVSLPVCLSVSVRLSLCCGHRLVPETWCPSALFCSFCFQLACHHWL
ncbi:hypothetical protein LZ32DRAFT_607781 [Colletotrichum eremochloae]|nr:hypothetical protein LZ32DRAFT_607781 [Colletotrichum eremochloae]